jgi:Fe-S oxidoreductase
VIQAAGIAPVMEMARTAIIRFAGAGGAVLKEEEHGSARQPTRYAEAQATGAETLAVGCPFCMRMFTDASQAEPGKGGPAVKDVAEIIAEVLELQAGVHSWHFNFLEGNQA